MDIHMPVMDGLAATRAIRAMEAERGLARTPIVALTAAVADEDRAQCLEAGVDEVMAKPVKAETLHEALGRLVRGRGAGATTQGRAQDESSDGEKQGDAEDAA